MNTTETTAPAVAVPEASAIRAAVDELTSLAVGKVSVPLDAYVRVHRRADDYFDVGKLAGLPAAEAARIVATRRLQPPEKLCFPDKLPRKFRLLAAIMDGMAQGEGIAVPGGGWVAREIEPRRSGRYELFDFTTADASRFWTAESAAAWLLYGHMSPRDEQGRKRSGPARLL